MAMPCASGARCRRTRLIESASSSAAPRWRLRRTSIAWCSATAAPLRFATSVVMARCCCSGTAPAATPPSGRRWFRTCGRSGWSRRTCPATVAHRCLACRSATPSPTRGRCSAISGRTGRSWWAIRWAGGQPCTLPPPTHVVRSCAWTARPRSTMRRWASRPTTPDTSRTRRTYRLISARFAAPP